MTLYYYVPKGEVTTVWCNLVEEFGQAKHAPFTVDHIMDSIETELTLFNGIMDTASGAFQFDTDENKFAFLLKWS